MVDVPLQGGCFDPDIMMNNMEKEYAYDHERSGFCTCTKEVTRHVVVMVSASIVYLFIGGLVGFYLGKYSKSTLQVFNHMEILYMQFG